MEKRYLELRCSPTINEENGMVGLFQKDIDEATAAVYVFLSQQTKLTYLCRESAAGVIASASPEILLDSASVWAKQCKAFLAGYCYQQYGQIDALKAETSVSITANLPEGYIPENDQ